MAEAAVEFPSVPNYFCHRCARSIKINPSTLVLACPHCESEFIEELTQELEENDQSRSNSRLTASQMDVATLLSNIFASVATSSMDENIPRIRNTRNLRNHDNDDDEDKDGDDDDEEDEEEEVGDVDDRGMNRRMWSGPYRPVASLSSARSRSARRRRNQDPRAPPRFLGNMLFGRYPNFSDLFAISSQEFHSNPRDYAWGSDGLDNIITQLLNQMENSGPAPAKDEDIKKLPDVLMSKDLIETVTQCSVCMDFFIMEELVKELPCHHHYHKECIVPWLKMHGTCPICRYSISPEDTTTNTKANIGINNNSSNDRNSSDQQLRSRLAPSSSSSSSSLHSTPHPPPQTSSSSSSAAAARMMDDIFHEDNLHRIVPMEDELYDRNDRFINNDDEDDDGEEDDDDNGYDSNMPNLDFIVEDGGEAESCDDDKTDKKDGSDDSNKSVRGGGGDGLVNTWIANRRMRNNNNFRFFNTLFGNRAQNNDNNYNNNNNNVNNANKNNSNNTSNNRNNNGDKR